MQAWSVACICSECTLYLKVICRLMWADAELHTCMQALAILLERAWYQSMGSLGSVVMVMLQDSGIDRQHPMFAQSARAFFDNWVTWGMSVTFMSLCIHFLWLPPCRQSPASCFVP